MLEGCPQVDWYEKDGKKFLKFTFEEHLTERDADLAILKWKQAFQIRKCQSIDLIWDCRKMKQYESGARQKWTNTLFELKSQINSIWLITESSIIKMGASVMSMATSLNIKTVASENEVAL